MWWVTKKEAREIARQEADRLLNQYVRGLRYRECMDDIAARDRIGGGMMATKAKKETCPACLGTKTDLIYTTCFCQGHNSNCPRCGGMGKTERVISCRVCNGFGWIPQQPATGEETLR